MWFLYGLTILAGLANAVQPGQNATLSKSLGAPVTAGLIILLLSTIAMLVGGLAIGKLEWPGLDRLAEAPWWAWPGGVLSVLLILAQLYASPAIGAASFLGIIVTVGVLARWCSTTTAGSASKPIHSACGAALAPAWW